MENTFLNYDNKTGLSTSTSRNNGFAVDKLSDFIECIINEEEVTIYAGSINNLVKDSLESLQHVGFLSCFNWTQEQVENAYHIFKSFLNKNNK